MKMRIIFLLFVVLAATILTAECEELAEGRPVYVIAHRTNGVWKPLLGKNVFTDMEKSLAAGANMIEADFMVDDDGDIYLEHDFINRRSTPFADWAIAINDMAADNEGFVGILFDIKSPEGENVERIVTEARAQLDSRFKLIFSVAELEDAKKGSFTEVFTYPAFGEGISIDYSDAEPVHSFFENSAPEDFDNFWYGIGISSLLPEPASVEKNVKKAISLRDEKGLFKKVYAWTFAKKDSMKHYFELGVDGLIVDRLEGFEHTEVGVERALAAIREINQENPGSIRLANRNDACWVVYP